MARRWQAERLQHSETDCTGGEGGMTGRLDRSRASENQTKPRAGDGQNPKGLAPDEKQTSGVIKHLIAPISISSMHMLSTIN